MIQFLLAAPNSGSGKTTLACALLAALKNRGYAPCAFKCGPDYIDPMFHRAVLGVESHNLDLFFSSPETARGLYASGAAGHGAAVCEGAMGFYDGLSGTSTTASAWQVADTLNLPVLLVVRPKGASLTLAAQIKGLQSFRTPSHLAGILLNDCKPGLYKMLAPMLEAETGLPVAGFLPPVPEAAIGSRHLGLYTAGEVADLQQKIALLAQAACSLRWTQKTSIGKNCFPSVSSLPRQQRRSNRNTKNSVSKSRWRGMRRSALPTPKRWRPLPPPGQSLSRSARCGTRPCRRGPAGCTCPAATRSSTPRP